MDRGAWRATVHGVTKSQTQLSDTYTHTHTQSYTPLPFSGSLSMSSLFILYLIGDTSHEFRGRINNFWLPRNL